MSSRPSPREQPVRPAVRPMAPLLEEEEDTRSAEEIEREHAGIKAPQTGEDFFDDAATATEADED